MARYVAGCVKCQKSKTNRHGRQTKLAPMPKGQRPLKEIVMDFDGELLQSEDYITILVVTDRFT